MMRLATGLAGILCLVALVHANDTHEIGPSSYEVVAPVSSATHAARRPAGMEEEVEDLVSMLQVGAGGDPATMDSAEIEDDPEKPKGPDTPAPWAHPEPPYDLWANQATAFSAFANSPDSADPSDANRAPLLGPPVPAPTPPVHTADVQKYREGREGDEVGIKIHLKELRMKSNIAKTNSQRAKFDSERQVKERYKTGEKTTQKEFASVEAKGKEQAKEAAKDPKKGGAGADERNHKASVERQKEEKAKQDEVNQNADGDGPEELGEAKDAKAAERSKALEGVTKAHGEAAATVQSHAMKGVSVAHAEAENTAKTGEYPGGPRKPSKAEVDVDQAHAQAEAAVHGVVRTKDAPDNTDDCIKAAAGITSICKLAGDEDKGCQAAKAAFGNHCKSLSQQSASSGALNHCENASDGVDSICLLTGLDDKACTTAKSALAQHCSEEKLESASNQVKQIKKDAGKKLARRLERVNKQTDKRVKDLEAQEAAVSTPEAKKKIQEQITEVKARAAKKIVTKARRVQRRAARKIGDKVATAVTEAEKKPKVGTEKRAEKALGKEKKEAKAELEKLEMEKSVAVSGRSQRKLERKIKAKKVEAKEKLEDEAKHIARKQTKKRVREAKKKADTEIAMLKAKQKAASSEDKKEELSKKMEQVQETLNAEKDQIKKRIKEKTKREAQKAEQDSIGSLPVQIPKSEKQQMEQEVEKMVAKSAENQKISARVKRRVDEKVAEAKESFQKKADKEIAKDRADEAEEVSELKEKAKDGKVGKKVKDVNDHLEGKASERDKIDAALKSKTAANVTQVYVKANSTLHQQEEQQKADVSQIDSQIKGLEEKKGKSQDPLEQRTIDGQIKKLHAKGSNMPADYYHKTGPASQEMRKEAEHELAKTAADAGHTGAAAQDAVEAAAPQAAEQKHQAAEAEKLKMEHGAKSSTEAPNQQVLRAKVDAAKNLAQQAEHQAVETVKTPGSVSHAVSTAKEAAAP